MNIAEMKAQFLKDHKATIKVDDTGKMITEDDQFAFINFVLAKLSMAIEDNKQALSQALLSTPKKLELMESRVKWLEQREVTNRGTAAKTTDQGSEALPPRKAGKRA